MKKAIHRARAALLAAMTAGALGFGAVQAMASPAPPAPRPAVCDEEACDLFCLLVTGYSAGTCRSGWCLCAI